MLKLIKIIAIQNDADFCMGICTSIKKDLSTASHKYYLQHFNSSIKLLKSAVLSILRRNVVLAVFM
jgi:hypothetical protein